MARGARARRPVENQPTAHNARTARCVLGAVVCAANSRRAPPHAVGRGSLRRHRARSAAAASNRRSRLFLVPWRAARARFVTWRTSRPPTEHALRAACLARLSARPTRDALHPTPLAEAPLRRHRARSAAAASNRRSRLFLVPWRAARARFVTWRTSRPPTEHLSLRAACLARLSARPTRDALHPTSLTPALNRAKAQHACVLRPPERGGAGCQFLIKTPMTGTPSSTCWAEAPYAVYPMVHVVKFHIIVHQRNIRDVLPVQNEYCSQNRHTATQNRRTTTDRWFALLR